MENFAAHYQKVVGIVHKARREYYIKLWDKGDWDQEGMFILYKLLLDQPWLLDEDEALYRYFKVKFRHHVVDVIRKQESQKRRFDRMHYEELGSVSHRLACPGLPTDEGYILRDRLQSYYRHLSPEERLNYERLLSGECFSGRKAMLRELRLYLS